MDLRVGGEIGWRLVGGVFGDAARALLDQMADYFGVTVLARGVERSTVRAIARVYWRAGGEKKGDNFGVTVVAREVERSPVVIVFRVNFCARRNQPLDFGEIAGFSRFVQSHW